MRLPSSGWGADGPIEILDRPLRPTGRTPKPESKDSVLCELHDRFELICRPTIHGACRTASLLARIPIGQASPAFFNDRRGVEISLESDAPVVAIFDRQRAG